MTAQQKARPDGKSGTGFTTQTQSHFTAVALAAMQYVATFEPALCIAFTVATLHGAAA